MKKLGFKNNSPKINLSPLTIFLILNIVLGVLFALAVKSDNSEVLALQVQQNFNAENYNSYKDVDLIESRIKSNSKASFSYYNVSTEFPYVIYKNGRLLFWTNYKYIPSIEKIRKDLQFVDVDKPYIKYLNSRRFNFKDSEYIITSIIDLKTEFKSETSYLKNTFNKNIFPKEPKQISFEPKQNFNIIKNVGGKALFHYSFEKEAKKSLQKTNEAFMFLVPLCIVLCLLTFYFVFPILEKKYKLRTALGILFLYLLILRTSIYFFPFLVDWFDYQGLNLQDNGFRSFIDKLYDLIFCFIFLLVFAVTIKKNRFLISLRNKIYIRRLLAVLCVSLFVFSIFSLKFSANYIVSNDFFNQNNFLNLDFNKIQILAISYLILLSGMFFCLGQIFIYVFSILISKNNSPYLYWLYGFLFSFFIIYYVYGISWAALIGGVYFLLVYFSKFVFHFNKIRFQSILYYVSGIATFALLITHIAFVDQNQKELEAKENFGERYLSDRDLIGEGLLNELSQNIKVNPDIIEALKRETFSNEIISQIVKDKLLNIYFSNYNTEVLSFNPNSFALSDLGYEISLDSIKNLSINTSYATNFKNLHLLNNSSSRTYFLNTPVLENGDLLGTVVLKLSVNPGSVQIADPILSKKFVQNPESKDYSYAIYNNEGLLLESNGYFNYKNLFRNFNVKMFDSKYSFNNNNFKHLIVKKPNFKKFIVVSEQDKTFKNALSNYATYFLIFLLASFFVIGLNALFFTEKGNKKLNFSTKIQLYLNAALLIPLIVLIVITISLLKSNLADIQDKSLINSTKNITSTIQILLDNYRNGKSSEAYFTTELNSLANNQKLDLSLFNNSGQLIYTSRPKLYQDKVVSTYLNSSAMIDLFIENENDVLFSETLGNLNYKSIYTALKDKNSKIIGVVSIPFFDANTSLNAQVKELVSTLLILFLGLFLILLIGSYVASNYLIKPLKHISQKIRKTNLEKQNEAIEWNSNDEIGMLTKAYNNMISKLEESKLALSQSEKQTAWREMAKQVAHEIKNPLTPMKLSIQQLQRTLPDQDPVLKERMSRGLNSITEQIENINDIANSFSEFAKMPVPKSEVFDMVSTTQKAVDLYMQNNNIKIDWLSLENSINVKGDRMFFSRVITNLILNGIQAVSADKQAEIKVKVYKESKNAIVAITDNGSGIPESIRKKVFISNFSTKASGSGLGLAMAKKGIEHAGGNVWFDSTEGVGTTFFVDLPIVE